jgi:uncharacterized LabA/DUF88 family protein
VRTAIYVDGFNLYYGALKGTPYKWLNIDDLMPRLLPPICNVTEIKYFTARVSGATDIDAPRRQAIYLSALRTIPHIEIHFGSFLSKTIWRPTITLPVANRNIRSPVIANLPAGDFHVDDINQTLAVGSYPPRGAVRVKTAKVPLRDAVVAEVHTMEEKGSDVNIAAHLLNDAWKDEYDVAVVISNDSDLVAPIRMVVRERRKIVYIVCPSRRAASKKLTAVASGVRHIHPAMLVASQFPNPIPGTLITKPATW